MNTIDSETSEQHERYIKKILDALDADNKLAGSIEIPPEALECDEAFLEWIAQNF